MRYYVRNEQRELPETPSFQMYFDPRETAVVSIDMHEGHLSEDPNCPCPAPRGRQLVESIDHFHRAARNLDIPIVHVVSTVRPSGRDDIRGTPAAWRITMPEYFGPIPGAAEHGIEGSEWTKLRTEVDPRDEFVRTKRRLSAFYPTDLDFLLRQMGVKTVVFTGINADCCVLNSSFDASNRNYRVIVPRDLVAGTEPDLEDAGLAIISLFLGLVVKSEDLLSTWYAAMGRETELATA
ncbi:cysteine hydrolase [Rhodococcus pyridinivorans]|uniref:cysteine hydrolase family protein n=1 Tax=Rhodococcus pyridinivorans TaxID=103816 RepID=UPI0020C6A3FB|nr:isochorismatase family cysteine hydrolase [Rhodococcus pyridinivorans]UTM38050.1 cysteine hydrolase [Rhodococcus pyridinivorans]